MYSDFDINRITTKRYTEHIYIDAGVALNNVSVASENLGGDMYILYAKDSDNIFQRYKLIYHYLYVKERTGNRNKFNVFVDSIKSLKYFLKYERNNFLTAFKYSIFNIIIQ